MSLWFELGECGVLVFAGGGAGRVRGRDSVVRVLAVAVGWQGLVLGQGWAGVYLELGWTGLVLGWAGVGLGWGRAWAVAGPGRSWPGLAPVAAWGSGRGGRDVGPSVCRRRWQVCAAWPPRVE